jgi:hypothetical protein
MSALISCFYDIDGIRNGSICMPYVYHWLEYPELLLSFLMA